MDGERERERQPCFQYRCDGDVRVIIEFPEGGLCRIYAASGLFACDMWCARFKDVKYDSISCLTFDVEPKPTIAFVDHEIPNVGIHVLHICHHCQDSRNVMVA